MHFLSVNISYVECGAHFSGTTNQSTIPVLISAKQGITLTQNEITFLSKALIGFSFFGR